MNPLMCLCMLVIMQDTSRITLYESPMMHFLAFQGIDEQGESLRSAFHYTLILAATLWVFHLKIYMLFHEQPCNLKQLSRETDKTTTALIVIAEFICVYI
jgi:hypothetical protein